MRLLLLASLALVSVGAFPDDLATQIAREMAAEAGDADIPAMPQAEALRKEELVDEALHEEEAEQVEKELAVLRQMKKESKKRRLLAAKRKRARNGAGKMKRRRLLSAPHPKGSITTTTEGPAPVDDGEVDAGTQEEEPEEKEELKAEDEEKKEKDGNVAADGDGGEVLNDDIVGKPKAEPEPEPETMKTSIDLDFTPGAAELWKNLLEPLSNVFNALKGVKDEKSGLKATLSIGSQAGAEIQGEGIQEEKTEEPFWNTNTIMIVVIGVLAVAVSLLAVAAFVRDHRGKA